MGIVEGQVNIDDVLNTDIGQPIRMRAPGMVQPFAVPFVGKEAFPVLGYLDEAKKIELAYLKLVLDWSQMPYKVHQLQQISRTMSGAQGRVELIADTLQMV